MTAADLSGRDLDVAVARALGCLEHYEHGCNARWMRYSTDPATLDEKLAWLRDRCDYVEIIVWRDGEVEAATCRSSMHRGDRRMHGRNLHEAVARLVVAVKEAMP